MLESEVQKLQEELAEVKQQFLIKQEHSDTEKQENRKNNQYLQDSVSVCKLHVHASFWV